MEDYIFKSIIVIMALLVLSCLGFMIAAPWTMSMFFLKIAMTFIVVFISIYIIVYLIVIMIRE